MNGAEILVKSLESLGVKRIFGYPGAAICPVFHALGASSISVTVNSNEQACAFAAGGVSRASDQVGVAVVTSGPAITNTLTAVADANADSIPLLVIAGQVPSGKLGTDEFQHIDVSGVFAKASKKVVLVGENSPVEEVVKDAYYFAKADKPGPVVIDFPFDAQVQDVIYEGRDPEDFRLKYHNETRLGPSQCREFFDLLSQAKRPLLYVGGGLNNISASRKIRRFNNIFAIPTINSLMGKGILDESRPTSLGMLGMFGVPYANQAIQETDLFVALGVRWDDRVSQKVGEAGLEADIAYVDINASKVQEVRMSRRPRFSFIGDAGTALQDLLEYAADHPVELQIQNWQQRVMDMKAAMALNYNRESPLIQQAEVMAALSGLINDEMLITTGVGNHQMLAAQYLKITRPRSFLTSGGFGVMGFSLPSAIGAHYARPEDTIIAIDGDGSLRMNMGELYTIGTNNLPIKVLLLNNQSAGMVRNIQTARYEGRIVATEEGDRKINFANIAKECGFKKVQRVDKRQNLLTSLNSFVAEPGQAFLEVRTDIDEVVYPVIAPGQGYKDMQLGPYINGLLPKYPK